MKQQLAKFFLIGIASILVGCAPKVYKTIDRLSNNVTEPVYNPFNLPQSQISLPAIFVGEEKSVESACFISDSESIEMEAPDSLKILVNRDTKLKASFQAELEKELIKAGLNSELAKSTSKKISIKAEGMNILKLSNISKVKPDFNSASCNMEALHFYVNDRTIITGALKAEKFIVSTESGLSNELKAKLNAVIDTLKIKLGINFERAVNASGEFEYASSNVYFGALTTSLTVVKCNAVINKVKIKPGSLLELKKKKLCSDFVARFKRSIISNDFTVEIFPENSARFGSGQIDVPAGKVTDILVNDVSLASVTIDETGDSDRFNIKLNLQIVGIDAEQIYK